MFSGFFNEKDRLEIIKYPDINTKQLTKGTKNEVEKWTKNQEKLGNMPLTTAPPRSAPT